MRPLFVTPFPLSSAALALVNPLAGTDQGLATWFHLRLAPLSVAVLRALSEPGSSEFVGVALFFGAAFFVWKRWWPSLASLIIAVPGGMLLNDLIKLLVQRQRPFVEGPFVDWSGYSFASGHTIGATLLFGQLLVFVLPFVKSRAWRKVSILAAVTVVVLVGFARIALGAHYLTDVLAAMFFGALWLMFCFFGLKPLHRARSKNISDGLPVEHGALALIPVPVTET